jgi:S1-C subfamily serine protease
LDKEKYDLNPQQSNPEDETELELFEFDEDEDDEEWEREKEQRRKRSARIRKIVGGLLAIVLIVSSLQLLSYVFNLPSIEFLKVSRQLSQEEKIQEYKKAVVTIQNGNSKGTGFNIASDGLIVTNKHVVDEKDVIYIYFQEFGAFIGEVLYEHPQLDLALVEIDGEGLPTLPVSNEENWQSFIGEDIVFTGNPLAHSQIANMGTVTGEVYLNSLNVPIMEITAPVYKGNSGSPVINPDGEVIGVIFATLDSSRLENGKVRSAAVPAVHIIEALDEVQTEE